MDDHADSESHEEEHLDFGTLLLAMAQDRPPRRTVPDAIPVPGTPVDAALAAFHAACVQSDADNDREAMRMWEQRQKMYREAIEGGETT